MTINDEGSGTQNTGGDQTPEQNDISSEDIESVEDEGTKKKLQTLDAQRKSWREKAVDPETGKTFRELYEEAQKKGEDKTSQNDQPSNENQPEEFGLVERTFLNSNGVQGKDEVELAREVQKETGMNWENLVESDYFKYRLEQHRQDRSSADATDVDGGGKGSSEGKNDPNYWIQLGRPPTREEADKKTRVAAMKHFMGQKGNPKTFYNE